MREAKARGKVGLFLSPGEVAVPVRTATEQIRGGGEGIRQPFFIFSIDSVVAGNARCCCFF